MKICFTHKPINTSFGGGNQFVLNMIKFIKNKDVSIQIVFDLNHRDIDIIFVLDPRILSCNKINYNMVSQYKTYFPNVKIIHRVNDCDKPRGNYNVLDPIIMRNFKINDLTIFVSKWTYEYYKKKGFDGNYKIINNGCDVSYFFPKKYIFDKKNINIVTHHWSDNWNKGFEYYNAIAEYIKNKKNIKFTFIGRKYNNKEGIPNNINIIGPYNGIKLGNLLRENDIYLTGSKFDNCPMHVIEGLSCGLPMLYHEDIGGGEEICENNGEKFSDINTMIEKLNKIIDNYDTYLDIDYKKLSSDTCCKKYYNEFINLLT
jgi:hypothetical protein